MIRYSRRSQSNRASPPITRVDLDLADAFAAAAIDSSMWLPALDRLASATGSMRGQLIGIGGERSIPFNLVTNASDKMLADFVAIDGGSPDVNYRVGASIGTTLLTVVHEAHYAVAIPRLKTDVYVDSARDNDHPFGCQTNLFDDEDGLVGLALLRSAGDGPTTEGQRRIFAAAAPHVRSAVHIQRALDLDGAKLVTGAFEAMTSAAFICDALLRVCALTSAAERLVADGALRLSARRLSSARPDETEALDSAIRRAGCSVIPPPVCSVTIHGSNRELPLILDVTALPQRAWSLGVESRVLVVARRNRPGYPQTTRLLRDIFGLTISEAEIVLALSEGTSRAEIAAMRDVSVSTVRTQIKNVFAKLGFAREGELIAWVNRLL